MYPLLPETWWPQPTSKKASVSNSPALCLLGWTLKYRQLPPMLPHINPVLQPFFIRKNTTPPPSNIYAHLLFITALPSAVLPLLNEDSPATLFNIFVTVRGNTALPARETCTVRLVFLPCSRLGFSHFRTELQLQSSFNIFVTVRGNTALPKPETCAVERVFYRTAVRVPPLTAQKTKPVIRPPHYFCLYLLPSPTPPISGCTYYRCKKARHYTKAPR